MDAYKTHGAFSWNELLTSDPAAAVGFYKELFGWSVETMDMPQGPYHVVKADGTSIGGIMQMPEHAAGQGVPPHWGSYITVDDVDAAAARATALGGRVALPPMDIPGVGRMAVLLDPQGAAINVITYQMPDA